MPETSRLYLHSPAGSDVAVYRWPLHVSDSWNEPHEIVETIRWVCNDFPELKLAVENYVLNNFDTTNFESMRLLCEKYNRAVDNIRKLWSGRQPPPCIDAPPTLQLLKHIINQVYNRAIDKPEELNSYRAFSPEVYGETSFELISAMMSATHMSENDIFLDLGSGVGQIVLQVAAATGCKSYGIEKADIPAKYAEEMDRQFVKWMNFYGKSYGEFELLRGDFLDEQFDEIFQSATVIFCNNFAFGSDLNHKLKLKFQNLRDGVKIVSSREFCPLNFRITERNLSDIGAMMRVAVLSPLKGSVSWTSKPVTYYLHRIDRTRLEEFFHKQKHADDVKSEGSTCYQTSTSGGVSSEGEDEDTSLNSSDDELFRRTSEELHHFPANTNYHMLSNSSHRGHTRTDTPTYRKGQQAMDVSSQRGRTTEDGTITSSAKTTPPSGLTHLPRPHPQSVINERQRYHHDNKHRLRSSVKTSQRKLSVAQKNKGGAVKGRGTMDMTPLFEGFSNQIKGYIDHMADPQFALWVNDSIEKEKLKRKHLQGVIEHLESEVSYLSVDAINNMKYSMSSLGITNLTPEGLLLGAKDIVMLNRQLRKEVQMLEKDVNKLKGENNFISTLCKHQTVTNSNHETANEMDSGIPNMEISKVDTPPLIEMPSVTVTSSVINMDDVKCEVGGAITDMGGATTEMGGAITDSNTAETINVTTPTLPLPLPTSQDKMDVANETPLISTKSVNGMGVSSPNVGVVNTPIEVKPSSSSSCMCIMVEEACLLTESELNNEYNRYQISLETIDQAVLELGPFAKNVKIERHDLPPLNWPHPLELHSKKERKKPYSPPTRASRKARVSSDCPSPLSSIGSPGGAEPITKHPPSLQRRINKKKHNQSSLELESSPLVIVNDANDCNMPSQSATPISVNQRATPTPTCSSKSVVQESTAVEAMLALSSRRPLSTPPTSVQDTPTIPKVYQPLPINKLSDIKKQHISSTHSNVRTTEEGVTNVIHTNAPPTNAPPTRPVSATTTTDDQPIKISDDRRGGNPFWPVSSDQLQYPVVALPNWNTLGGLHPTYIPPYPTRPPSEGLTPSLDLNVPRPTVLPSYYFYGHTYPFGASGLTTPLANQLITPPTSSLQSPRVSSPHISYNPYMTPPTLHPLNEVAKSQTTKDINWMVASQIPQNNFLANNQFGSGLGVASPHLSLFHGLQSSNILPTIITGDSIDNKKHSHHQTDHTQSIIHSAGGTRYTDIGNESMNIAMRTQQPPFVGLSNVDCAKVKRESKLERKKKLKIHQMNTEDFSNKATSSPDRKTSTSSAKKATDWSGLLSNKLSMTPPTSDYKITPISATPISQPAHLPTLVTMTSCDETEQYVKVDVDDVSSEGTMSASPEPPVTTPTNKDKMIPDNTEQSLNNTTDNEKIVSEIKETTPTNEPATVLNTSMHPHSMTTPTNIAPVTSDSPTDEDYIDIGNVAVEYDDFANEIMNDNNNKEETPPTLHLTGNQKHYSKYPDSHHGNRHKPHSDYHRRDSGRSLTPSNQQAYSSSSTPPPTHHYVPEGRYPLVTDHYKKKHHSKSPERQIHVHSEDHTHFNMHHSDRHTPEHIGWSDSHSYSRYGSPLLEDGVTVRKRTYVEEDEVKKHKIKRPKGSTHHRHSNHGIQPPT